MKGFHHIKNHLWEYEIMAYYTKKCWYVYNYKKVISRSAKRHHLGHNRFIHDGFVIYKALSSD